MTHEAKTTFVSLWWGSWFFRLNVVIVITGLVYFVTH